MLLSNYADSTQKVTLDLHSVVGKDAHILHIDEDGNLDERTSFTVGKDATVTLTLPKYSLVFIEVK